MSDDSCEVVIGELADVFRSQLELHRVDDGCVIVTPLTYPDMDAIELFVQRAADSYRISDDGNTLNMLFVNGLALERNKTLMAEAVCLASDHGVALHESELVVDATPGKLGEASLDLLNAIQGIGYMLYRRRHGRRATFARKIEELFLTHRTEYSPNFAVRGKASLNRIRFHVNSDRNLLIEPVSANTVTSARDKAVKVAYKWSDIQNGYNDRREYCPFKLVSVLDDRDERGRAIWSDTEAITPLMTYSDTLIRWETEQPTLVELLTK